jgi:hypothetical protein
MDILNRLNQQKVKKQAELALRFRVSLQVTQGFCDELLKVGIAKKEFKQMCQKLVSRVDIVMNEMYREIESKQPTGMAIESEKVFNAFSQVYQQAMEAFVESLLKDPEFTLEVAEALRQGKIEKQS